VQRFAHQEGETVVDDTPTPNESGTDLPDALDSTSAGNAQPDHLGSEPGPELSDTTGQPPAAELTAEAGGLTPDPMDDDLGALADRQQAKQVEAMADQPEVELGAKAPSVMEGEPITRAGLLNPSPELPRVEADQPGLGDEAAPEPTAPATETTPPPLAGAEPPPPQWPPGSLEGTDPGHIVGPTQALPEGAETQEVVARGQEKAGGCMTLLMALAWASGAGLGLVLAVL
jgi:hypothetical protein